MDAVPPSIIHVLAWTPGISPKATGSALSAAVSSGKSKVVREAGEGGLAKGLGCSSWKMTERMYWS